MVCGCCTVWRERARDQNEIGSHLRVFDSTQKNGQVQGPVQTDLSVCNPYEGQTWAQIVRLFAVPGISPEALYSCRQMVATLTRTPDSRRLLLRGYGLANAK